MITRFLFFKVLIAIYLLISGTLSIAQADAPDIEIWYRNHQVFGQNGVPQTWVNVLGNVSPAGEIDKLTYTLNGGPPKTLTIGGDQRRLTQAGDFNIDIMYTDLKFGKNEVIITATNFYGEKSSVTVTIDYQPLHQLSLPYETTWTPGESIQNIAQVVDGKWQIDENGVRPVVLGYDRLINIGDTWWENYEVTVPVTIHKAEPVYSFPSYGAWAGIVMRWQGHRIWDDSQPAYGWWPLGAAASIDFPKPTNFRVALLGNKVLSLDTNFGERPLEFGHTYLIKLRGETLPGYGTLYSFKYWPENQSEPETWNFKGYERLWNPMFGSVLLVAHHTDVTFGNVSINPLARSPWEWFSLLGSYVAQIPILLISLAGLGLSFIHWRKSSRQSKLTALTFVFLTLYALGGTFLDIQLPEWLHRLGWSTHEIGIILVGYETTKSLVLAAAFGLLILAIFPISRKESTSNNDANQSDVSKL